MHQIQKYIIKVLIYQASARFSELKPPKTDSNLFSYHLKSLIKDSLIEKRVTGGYSLTPSGLFLADRISGERLEPRLQPKIITAAVLTDIQGRVGVIQRNKQPFIGEWTLPSGKLHLGEQPIEAVRREVLEKCHIQMPHADHVGDCYINAYQAEVLVSGVLAHIYHAEYRGPETSTVRWVMLGELADLALAPGVRRIIRKTLASDSDERFFAVVTSRR